MSSQSDRILEAIRSIPRHPERMGREQLYPIAYYYMYLSRHMDEKFKELFQKGHVKGTVTLSHGNEATTVGFALPFRIGKDIVSLLHRDIGAHLVSGVSPFSLLCQYMANAQSPTHGQEGNVHHGNIPERRFPMISHLGNMLAPTVGGVWAARQNGENVFGVTTIGDGGSSTGDFHESLNLASVQKVPVLFVIENNYYAYSTPTKLQYNCQQLSERAKGYGIEGRTIDGTDVWEVYSATMDALDTMAASSLPYLLECNTLRLEGHAVYDKAEYVPDEERKLWLEREPMAKTRQVLKNEYGYSDDDIGKIENMAHEKVAPAIQRALQCARPDPSNHKWDVFASPSVKKAPSFQAKNTRNLNAINAALDYILKENDRAFLCGQDIGAYGSAFKTCKGLFERYGARRVVDMPICESGTVGFCLGASQIGAYPIMEFQFADFSTEAVTQIGLNSGTWYFRSGNPAPMVFRLPCGGGINLGAFHSGEFDGLWSRFPGIKLLYPVTPQETFEALVAGFYDPNPCIILEHKLLYWGKQGDIDFDGKLESIFRPRQYSEGADITIIAMGAMVEQTFSAINQNNCSASVWNPFILNPLSLDPIFESIRKTGRLLVAQESGTMAGLGNTFISAAVRECFDKLKAAPVLVSAFDTPVPFAKELENYYLPNDKKISRAIASLIGAKGE